MKRILISLMLTAVLVSGVTADNQVVDNAGVAAVDAARPSAFIDDICWVAPEWRED